MFHRFAAPRPTGDQESLDPHTRRVTIGAAAVVLPLLRQQG
jgi:hypothetical protein